MWIKNQQLMKFSHLFIRISFFFILIFGCYSCADSSIVDKQKFTQLYLDSLEHKLPNEKFTYKKELLLITQTDSLYCYLDNAYAEYCSTPEQLLYIISKYSSSMAEIYHCFKSDKSIDIDNIIPIIKPKEYLEELCRISKVDKAINIKYLPYNDNLIIVFASDNKYSLSYINENELELLNLNNDSLLLNTAIRNLKYRIKDKVKRKGSNGVYSIAIDGTLESSSILLASLWNEKSFPVDGDIVITIPNRDFVFITGSNDKKAVDDLIKVTHDLYSNEYYPISNKIFRWNGNKFE